MRRHVHRLLLLAATGLAVLISSAAPAGAAPRATRVEVLRPVHADGRPVARYRVLPESWANFTCRRVAASGVDTGIAHCGDTTSWTPACWKSRNHTVLCLRDPWRRILVRIHYSGSFLRAAAPHHPQPEGLVLSNHEHCYRTLVRGVHEVRGHPHWAIDYGCNVGDVAGTGDGIDRRVQPWRVAVVRLPGRPLQSIRYHRVWTAILLGTAA